MKRKKRLDELVHNEAPTLSRRLIQSFIMQGKVTVDGKVVTKPGMQFSEDTKLSYNFEQPKYVSRAGYKLEKALDHFHIAVEGLIVMDAGLSTGGFSDCLLQRGAQKIYGVDVGHGQVHEKIAENNRVIVMERTNLRTLESLPEEVDLVTLDLSFISVLKVMSAVTRILKRGGELIVLIKPQFEAERHEVGRGGIIKNPEVHASVIKKVTEGIVQHGFEHINTIESPIEGTEGNKEFLAYFKH